MAKKASRGITRYKCGECGYMSLTMVGKCPSCGAWGSMQEEAPLVESPSGRISASVAKPIAGLEAVPEERIASGIDELDRVLGGGWTRSGVVLLGGEPGVGKSTLLLQVCACMARAGRKVLYISGEESSGQLAMRAKRLGIAEKNIDLLCELDLPPALESAKAYDFAVVDSVQSFRLDDESGWAGSPSQVRAAASLIGKMGKQMGIPVVMVGHITKQGQIAGPKILEHMVDVVLLFSGEKSSSYRLLRAEKNRYGSTEELGIFEMSVKGLIPVVDPSHLYWSAGEPPVSGVAIGITLEGSRPLAAEIQSLSCNTPFPYPKRTSRGIEINRLQLLLAVLERRCGIFSRSNDVYVNIAGGLTLHDPAADLSIVASLASSLKDVPLPDRTCFIGEVGLAGEVRPASRIHLRLKEAFRLGFKSAIFSSRQKFDANDLPAAKGKLELIKVPSITKMLEILQI